MTNEVQLRETGVTRQSTGKRRHAKLIAADVWGSTAFYPSEVLERDGARVFTKGVQMFENHVTDEEEYTRPEGSVGNLVGKLISDAVFEAEGEDGPGLYADVEFYDSYVPRINEIADDIGLSVRAQGLTESGERDGRYGPVLVALLKAQSVDVVTQAGAGGKLTSILESHRELAGRPIETEGTSVTDVTKEDFAALATQLQESIGGLAETFTTALTNLTESLRPATVEPVEVAEVTAVVESAAPEAVEIDHAAVLTQFTESALPTAVLGTVITAVREGATIEDAIATQVSLREAFVAQNETGTVVIKESAGAAKGLAFAVAELNG